MAAMVAGMAVAEPEANPAITTFSGRATTTWGVDLDDGGTGFKNDASLDFVVSLFDTGTKSTEGEGIWGELVINAGSNNSWNHYLANDWWVGAGDKSNSFTYSLSVDTAKLHFYNFYVGLLSGDTQVGKLVLTSAVRSTDNDQGIWLSNVGNSKTQGLVLGYGDNKNIGFELDFRSEPNTTGSSAGTKIYAHPDGKVDSNKGTDGEEIATVGKKDGTKDYYSNDYGIAGEFKLLDSNEFLNGLFVTVGGSLQFNAKNEFGIAASAGYKANINDTLYFKPVVGWTGSGDWNGISANKIAGGLFLGWGDTADSNAGVYYLDNDNAKKVTPGVGVNALVDLSTDKPVIYVTPSLYSNGTFVPNLGVGLYSDIYIPTDGTDAGFGIAGGVKYDLKATDKVTVTPKAGARFATKTYQGVPNNNDGNNSSKLILNGNTDNGGTSDILGQSTKGLLNVKAGIDVAGLLNNTTFGVYYQSRNLLNDSTQAGTINVFATLSF